MVYTIAKQVINIVIANHLVNFPLVLVNSTTDSTAITVGPTMVISPNGTQYPPILCCVVPKNSTKLKLTPNASNIISKIKIPTRSKEAAFVDLPPVL